MGKGAWRRPCQIPADEATKRWEEAFGPRTPNKMVMPDHERAELEAEKQRLIQEIEGGGENDASIDGEH